MRHRFPGEHVGEYRPTEKACEALHASKSGYHEFLGRKKSNQQIEREELEGFVKDMFEEHKGRYGSRRTGRQLASVGIRAGSERVPEVLGKLGLKARGATRRYRRHEAVEPVDPRADPVDRAFDVDGPNLLWVGDITNAPTRRGFPYQATVMDAWSRKVVGRSMSATATERLVVDAPEQAIVREDPPGHGLAFHDDRGCRCASRASRRAPGSHGITQSVPGPWMPIRRRRGRVVPRDARARDRQGQGIREPGGGETGDIQARRALPRYGSAALQAGLRQPDRVRA